MADYGSSGIWVAEAIGPFRHGMASHDGLSLPPELAADFARWIQSYWLRLEDAPFDTASFNAEGGRLASRLKQFVGPTVEVVFQPERDDGSLAPEEPIG